MSSGESQPINLEVSRAAYDLCEDIRHAVELTEQSVKLEEIAQRTASFVIQKTMFGYHPFRMEVRVPDEVESYVVSDDDVVDTNPKSFIATELRSVGKHGVEFFDKHTDRWLRIRGYDFEIVPVFEELPGKNQIAPLEPDEPSFRSDDL